MHTELLADAHPWLRICEASWDDPLDDTFAQHRGGRWNPLNSWRTLYVNEDEVTARLNLRAFVRGWPYEPEDLRGDTGPHLAVATLPRDQQVADAHSPAGVAALGLPATYPHAPKGELVDHATCQQVGTRIKTAGLGGVRCRSAQTPQGAGRELAWFPATPSSRATLLERRAFPDWYWS